MRIVGRDAECELMRIQLSQEHHTGLAKLARNGGVRLRHAILQNLRAAGCANSSCVVQVLEPDRHSMQSTPIVALGNLVSCALSVSVGALASHLDIGVDARIQALDATQILLRQLEW